MAATGVRVPAYNPSIELKIALGILRPAPFLFLLPFFPELRQQDVINRSEKIRQKMCGSSLRELAIRS